MTATSDLETEKPEVAVPSSSGPGPWLRSRLRRFPPLVLVAPSVCAAGVALLPLVYLAIRASERGWDYFHEVLARDRTTDLVIRSLTLAGVVTAGCLVVGVSLAGLVTRTELPFRRVWAVVVALPLAVPSYVAAFSWLSFFPYFGGLWGSALVLILCCYPYVYLPVAAALERVDPAQEEMARSLGIGPLRTFVTVTVRQVRPAAAGGALLVALYVLSDFGAVAMLRYDVFTRVIYSSYRSSFDPTPAAVLACLLVAITVVIVWAETMTRGRAGYARLGSGAPREQRRAANGWWTVPALIWCTGIVGLALGVPALALADGMTVGSSAGVDWSELTSAAGNTLYVSALGALAAIVLALPVGVLVARYPGWLSRILEQASYAGHALPGIVVALSMVFISVRYLERWYQEVPVLVLAYAVLFLPAAVGAVRASVSQSPKRLEEVGRSLGRSPAGVLRSVTVPLAAPGVAAGAALVFLTCMKELPATLLLHPTGTDTLATELWGRTEVGAYAAAAPYAATLVLLAAVPTFLLGQRWSPSRIGRTEPTE